MADRILVLRELNRATLARQMLLERERVPVLAGIERLVGLQAQFPVSPYLGLWTRLHDFARVDLARLIEGRAVVKATLMRATLHLFTADDYVRFRTTLQPMLEAAGNAIAQRRGGDFDLQRLLREARRYIGEKPRTFAEITAMVAKLMPNQDVGAARYTIRTHVPMVQVPIPHGWSYSSKPAFTLAESWIGRSLSFKANPSELVMRYLAAFGPASVADAQTWSGLKLKDTFEALRPNLQPYRDEKGRELFDLRENSFPGQDVPAPVRFLPEFDNLLLSHSDRTRFIAQEHRSKVYLPGLRVAATILVDGWVSGIWKFKKVKGSTVLTIQPFQKLPKTIRAALVEEGEQLIQFLEPGAKKFEVKFL
jgi:hypothetical protein